MIFYLFSIKKSNCGNYTDSIDKTVPDYGNSFFIKKIIAESEQEAKEIVLGTKDWKNKISYSEGFNIDKYSNEKYREALFKQAIKGGMVDFSGDNIYLLMTLVDLDIDKQRDDIYHHIDSIIKILIEKVKDYIDRVVDLKTFM